MPQLGGGSTGNRGLVPQGGSQKSKVKSQKLKISKFLQFLLPV
ncbi:hypothetical protein NSP_16280 [Nodularia spumigena CCY9414]|nr:hypothetical protein NSP_16280 [Nodularia spumigena CCY9414]